MPQLEKEHEKDVLKKERGTKRRSKKRINRATAKMKVYVISLKRASNGRQLKENRIKMMSAQNRGRSGRQIE